MYMKVEPAWSKASDAWDRWGWSLQRQYGAATEKMLDMASVTTGCHIIDIAAGPGYQTIQAAKKVGPSGTVLGVDLSAEMLAIARRNIDAQRLTNVAFKQADAATLEGVRLGFDGAICRLSLMIFSDPLAALKSAHTVLKPGGKLSVMVFSSPARNTFLSQPERIIRKRLGLSPPSPDQPGLFKLAKPETLERLFCDAQFRDFQCEFVEAPQLLSSSKEHVLFLQQASRALIELMNDAGEHTQRSIWREIEEAASAFDEQNGFVGPCEVILAAAAK